MLDEILAQTYFDNHHIGSVGLRLFSVYGPYDSPLSLTSQIADHAIAAMADPSKYHTLPNEAFLSRQDYVYVDDAVDAILISMQLRPRFGPLVINVGSGNSTGVSDLIQFVKTFVPDVKFKHPKPATQRTKQVDITAQTDRAKQLLGWEPRVLFEKGMLKTLGWHFDRLHPRGKTRSSVSDKGKRGDQTTILWESIAAEGRLACDRNDIECLRGMAVYPCASECAHVEQCHPSIWDAAAAKSRRLSSSCSEVWYTVALNRNLVALPSVRVRVSTKSRSNLTKCNFAFVSDESPLVQRLQSRSANDDALYYDFWTLIPVALYRATDADVATSVMVPKLSPSSFFANCVEIAVYSEPQIIFDDLPKLLSEVRTQPYNPEVPGATGLLVGIGKNRERRGVPPFEKRRIHQTGAYRMIHMKALEHLDASHDGFKHEIDTSFLVHRVGEQDVMSFRCDIFSEVWSWEVASDRDGMSFIAGLHDMWSQIIVGQKGGGNMEPWWYGENVETVSDGSREHRRRLEEADLIRSGPLQYHHLLQNQIGGDEDEQFEEVHHFDENGFGLQKKKLKPSADRQSERTSTGQETKQDTLAEHQDDVEDGHSKMTWTNHWLGILSSGGTRFFVRLVRAEDVGVLDLNGLSDQNPPLLL